MSNSQDDHERMIRDVVNFLRERGYRDIRADLPEQERPEEIVWRKTGKGQIPDVTAVGATPIVVEVETKDSLEDPHLADQWKLFAEHAKQSRGEFFVVVPKGLMDAAWRNLKLLGLDGNVWEI